METIQLVLIVGALSIFSFSSTIVIYTKLQSREKQFQARVVAVMSSFGKTIEVAVPIRRMVKQDNTGSIWSRIARIVGYKVEEPYLYVVKWWIIGIVALLPAKGASWVLAGFFGDLTTAFVMPAFWLLGCRMMFKAQEDRYVGKVLNQFPDALSSIVRSVRVGIPVNVAITTVAEEAATETAREFQRAAEKLAVGHSVEDAVAFMAEHARITEYRFFATALSLQSQTGGGLTETLENLADVIRKRVAMRSRGVALSSEAKTSAGILAVLPIITAGGLLVLSPAYAMLLFTDPGGRKLLAVAVFMLVGGILVMRHMIKKSLS